MAGGRGTSAERLPLRCGGDGAMKSRPPKDKPAVARAATEARTVSANTLSRPQCADLSCVPVGH